MLLTTFRVQRFRNVLDSTAVHVQPDVTCLVGKNESGKTALLQALTRANPAYPTTFDAQEHYPRWLLIRDRKKGSVDDAVPIEVTFALDDEDRAAVAEITGPRVFASDTFAFGRRYSGTYANVSIDEATAVRNLLGRLDLDPRTVQALQAAPTVQELTGAITALRARFANEESDAGLAETLSSDLDRVDAERQRVVGDGSLWQRVVSVLIDRMPTFFYFSDYSVLPGRLDLDELDMADEGPGTTGLQTARALLRLAGTGTEALREDEYEERKAELEAVSNDLTRQVFDYWTQNQELSVEIDIDKQTVSAPSPYGQLMTAVARFLDVRVKDRRHGFTGNFGQRSSGFQWFFSFLAAFSEFEGRDGGLVVLLDEPALTLHARAQADFLRFIEERLAPKAQVIYTTHSPFMVEAGRLERVRVVEDKGPEVGSTVSADVLTVDRDTLFPLQAALGYDIAHNLFIGETNLLVEGTSDYTYLTVMSDRLNELGRPHLDARWRIIPAGGAANVPAFVALIGRALNVTVLVDAGTQGMQRLSNLTTQGLLHSKRLLTVADVLTGVSRADIEDLFSEGDYLTLYNGAFGSKLKVADLQPGDRVVDRISRTTASGFTDHGRPADHLLRSRDRLLPGMSETTLSRFQMLIVSINATLPP